MKAIILVGGFGTRLKDLAKDIPKAMVMIAGKPFLEHLLISLKEQGITEIILAVHHMANKIKTHFGTGHRWGLKITYSDEETPLGTAGAIKNAEKYIDNTFLVLNGDCYSKLNLKEFINFHKSGNNKFSIALKKVSDSSHYGTVALEESKITNFAEKQGIGEGLINSGIYILDPQIFNYIESNKKVSIETEIFPRLVKDGLLYGFSYEGYFMDIGRPETYTQFKQDFLDHILLKKDGKVKEAMQKILNSGIDLVLIVDEERKLLGVVNDRIIKEFLINGGSIDDFIEKAMVLPDNIARTTDSKERISEILMTGVNRLPIIDELGRLVDVEFRVEQPIEESFPIIRGKAPLRVSFAGGGTDLPYFFEKYGGVVISGTIDRYCHATIVKRADSKITINSDIEGEIVINSISDLQYDENGS